jgi:pimeloyl-ACP methyl ester carboxylesterase
MNYSFSGQQQLTQVSKAWNACELSEIHCEFCLPIGYLKTRKEINSRQIGLAGHSEGGLIAPIVAARSKDVAFVIMLAGPGIPGDSSILLQMATLQHVRKYPEAQIQHAQAVFGGALKIVKHSSDRTILRERLKQYINANQWNKESRPEEREQECKAS